MLHIFLKYIHACVRVFIYKHTQYTHIYYVNKNFILDAKLIVIYIYIYTLLDVFVNYLHIIIEI